jgi:hypothetical protein
MTAETLLQRLLEIKADYGTLDVPINVWIQDSDRFQIAGTDVFTDGYEQLIHSIDIILKEKP